MSQTPADPTDALDQALRIIRTHSRLLLGELIALEDGVTGGPPQFDALRHMVEDIQAAEADIRARLLRSHLDEAAR